MTQSYNINLSSILLSSNVPTLAQTAISLCEPNTQSIHHQIQSNLHLHGLLKLPKLSDDNLNDSNHPFWKLRAAHKTDSGFIVATRRLDKFTKRFRMSVNEFMLLYEKLLSYLNRAMGSSEGQGSVAGRALTSAEMLLIWLWRADDVNVECLCIIFNDIDRTTIDRYADHTTKAIQQSLGDRLYWPDVEERELGYPMMSCYQRVVGIMDGTHCPIDVPMYGEYEHFSGYKGYHTQNFLVVVDPFGCFTWIKGPVPGRGNDRIVFNDTPFVNDDCDMLITDEEMLGDGGFRGPGRLLHQWLQGDLERAKSPEEYRDMVNWNEEFDLNRTRVEAAIGKLKRRSQSLSKKYPRDGARQAELLTATACLLNYLRDIRTQQSLVVNQLVD
jgi:hypothetical protein